MPIIKNWGFSWKREHIYRGCGGNQNAGHLKGKARGKTIADFRNQIGIYVLSRSSGDIVYVGQAGNGRATLFSRLLNHMDGRLSGRWETFTWFGFMEVNKDGSLSQKSSVDAAVSGFKYSQALDELEGVLIEVIEPTLNKQGGRLNGAVEYVQYIDDRVADISNAILLKEVENLQNQIEKFLK